MRKSQQRKRVLCRKTLFPKALLAPTLSATKGEKTHLQKAHQERALSQYLPAPSERKVSAWGSRHL